MPGILKTEAVVLRSIRFGEADRILHLYSTARGRIGAIAKGARRPRSRFGGRLEPFFRLDLVLHEGRGDLATVTSAATVDGYPSLRSSGPALAAAARGCDAVLRLLDAADPNPPAYNLLCRYLSLLDGPAGRSASAGDGACLPPQAGARRRILARAGLLRALRGGRAPERVLGRRRRRGLRRLRAGLLRPQPRGAPVHGGCSRKAARRGAGGGRARPAPGRAGGHRDARAPRPRAPAGRCLTRLASLESRRGVATCLRRKPRPATSTSSRRVPARCERCSAAREPTSPR